MEQNEKTFEEQLQELNLNVSEHAMDRYKERVRNDNTNILDEETKKKYYEELKKLFLSSEVVYTGVIGNSTNEVDVRLNKNGWTLICGKNQKFIITLYKVDLGVGDDDLNQMYVDKSLANIHKLIEEVKVAADDVDTHKIEYMEEIASNTAEIKELNKQITLLSQRNKTLEDLVKTEDAKTYKAKRALKDALQSYMVKDKLKIE